MRPKLKKLYTHKWNTKIMIKLYILWILFYDSFCDERVELQIVYRMPQRPFAMIKCLLVKIFKVFFQKSKFLWKIKIFVKNQNFSQKSKICQKSKFFSKIQMFVKNRNLVKILIFYQQKNPKNHMANYFKLWPKDEFIRHMRIWKNRFIQQNLV